MQQINLYQPMFRKQEKVFSAVTMLQISVLLVIVLAAIYGYSWWSFKPIETELARVETEQRRLQQEIERIRATSPPPVPSRLLEQEVARLSDELARMQQVKHAISGARFGNQEGFSSFLEGLARQHVSGLWLTHVNLSHGGTRVTLSGKAVSAELVPVYLQRLAGEQAFSGMSFNLLEVTRSQSDPSLIEFSVGTERDARRSG